MSEESNVESILTRLTKYVEDRAKVLKSTEVSTRKGDFLIDDIRSSMRYHPLINKFALAYDELISFGIGFVSAASTAYLVRRSFKARAFKMAILAGFGLPLALGASSATFHRINIDSLFRLEYNCKECYQIQTILSVNLFASINSFVLSNMIIWLGDTQIKNYSIFRRGDKESYGTFLKRLFGDFKTRTFTAKMYQKYGMLLAVTCLITYLFALEQQREFKIVFTNYYQGVEYKQQHKEHGIDLERNARI